MPYKYLYQGIHSCEAVVLTCIDFRFWRETLAFAENELGLKVFDFPSLPGGVKPINESPDGQLALSCIGVPCDLHHVKKIVLVNHEDCGAYGGSQKFGGDQKAEEEFHAGELKKASEKIKDSYPDKEIIMIYAKLSQDKSQIEFKKVAN